MKKTNRAILILVLGLNIFMVSAQKINIRENDSLNSEMKKIAKPESIPNWIKFKEELKINPKTIFIEYKKTFMLNENDSMALFKIQNDDLGYSHYFYQQNYKGILVDGGSYSVHTDRNGSAYSANGKLVTGINMSIVPALNEKQAIDFALNYVNAKEYRWQSELWEKDLKESTGKTDATYYPKPQLVIRVINNPNIDQNEKNKFYYLAYRLDIYSSSPFYSQRIYLDANTGKFLLSFPLQSN